MVGEPKKGPEPNTLYPMSGNNRLGFLKNFIKSKNIVVGDYTYYDDPDGIENFEKNVLYHFDFSGDKLIIGKFCAIATGVKFIMNGANHKLDWLTTYPFTMFRQGWEAALDQPVTWPNKGDTVVGNDVWLGYGALIMPGIKIGDGAVIGTMAVVTKDVPPYTIVGGNPAKEIRKRFAPEVIAKLLEIQWWNWDAAKITRNVKAICGGDVEALARCE